MRKNRRRRIILKKIIDLLLVRLVLMMGTGGGFLYREGMGYGIQALRQGNSKDPWGPPQAFEKSTLLPTKIPQNQLQCPLAPTEIWTLNPADGLQRWDPISCRKEKATAGSSSFTATAAMNALCGASLPII